MTTRRLVDVLTDLRTGPPTLDVRPTAELLDVSASGLYEAIRRGDAPVRTIRVGSRLKVVTASVIELLDGPARVIPGETSPHSPRSEVGGKSLTTSAVK